MRYKIKCRSVSACVCVCVDLCESGSPVHQQERSLRKKCEGKERKVLWRKDRDAPRHLPEQEVRRR